MLQQALEMRKRGERVNLTAMMKKLAEEMGKSYATVRRACVRSALWDDTRTIPHAFRLLSEEQERTAISAFLTMSRFKVSFTPSAARQMITDWFGVTMSHPTFTAMIQRYETIIRIGQGKVVTKSRVDKTNLTELAHFCNDLEGMSDYHEVSAMNLLNLDEVRLSVSRDGVAKVPVVAGRGKVAGNIQLTVDTTTLALLPIVSARGECLAVYGILRTPGATEASTSTTRADPSVPINITMDCPEGVRESRPLAGKPWTYYYTTSSTGTSMASCIEPLCCIGLSTCGKWHIQVSWRMY